MKTEHALVEGRRLVQRMLTHAVAKDFDACSAEIFQMTRIEPIMAGLNIAVNMVAGIISNLPEGERSEYLQDIALKFETNPTLNPE